VVIADDYAALRSLARMTLEEDGDIEVVGEAEDGVEAIAAVIEHEPDVLLLDLSMPRVDGLQVLVHLQQERVSPRIVIFSSHARERMIPLLIELGAADYVEKGASPEVLRRAVLGIDPDAATPRAAA
jgi:DNA-binding NarL/FixJ family response regulator